MLVVVIIVDAPAGVKVEMYSVHIGAVSSVIQSSLLGCPGSGSLPGGIGASDPPPPLLSLPQSSRHAPSQNMSHVVPQPITQVGPGAPVEKAVVGNSKMGGKMPEPLEVRNIWVSYGLA